MILFSGCIRRNVDSLIWTSKEYHIINVFVTQSGKIGHCFSDLGYGFTENLYEDKDEDEEEDKDRDKDKGKDKDKDKNKVQIEVKVDIKVKVRVKVDIKSILRLQLKS
jgi:hypothetical protein